MNFAALMRRNTFMLDTTPREDSASSHSPQYNNKNYIREKEETIGKVDINATKTIQYSSQAQCTPELNPR